VTAPWQDREPEFVLGWRHWRPVDVPDAHAAVEAALETAWGRAAAHVLNVGLAGTPYDWFDFPKKGQWVSDRGKHDLAR
jgi:hypothetical protein